MKRRSMNGVLSGIIPEPPPRGLGLGLGRGRSGASRHLNRGSANPKEVGGLCHPKDFVLRLDSPLCVWTSPSEGA